MSAIGLVFRVLLCAVALVAMSSSVEAKSCAQRESGED